MSGNGSHWLIAGGVGAALVPALVLGLDLPLLVAAGLAVLVFFGLLFLLAPRRLFEGIDISRLGRGRVDLARKVLGEALPHIEGLEAAALGIRKADVKTRVRQLATTASAIVAGVEQDANRLGTVSRFLVYYLPSAGKVVERYALLERMDRPDPALVAQSEGTIAKLEDAFSHYKDSLLDTDLADLDVELRLIDAAIRDDIRLPEDGGQRP